MSHFLYPLLCGWAHKLTLYHGCCEPCLSISTPVQASSSIAGWLRFLQTCHSNGSLAKLLSSVGWALVFEAPEKLFPEIQVKGLCFRVSEVGKKYLLRTVFLWVLTYSLTKVTRHHHHDHFLLYPKKNQRIFLVLSAQSQRANLQHNAQI